MIIDLVEKLIDRCISLIRERKQLRKNLAEHYLDPAFEQFETVHKAYLDSFLKYRDMVDKSPDFNESFQQLIDEIKKDAIYSHGDRARLGALAQYDDDLEVGPFVQSIASYLGIPYTSLPLAPMNAIRVDLEFFLHRAKISPRQFLIANTPPDLTENEMVKAASITTIDGVATSLQTEYGKVTSEFITLKRKLVL